MSDEMETISEAMDRLRAAGYTADWRAVDGRLASDDASHDPADVTIDEIVRFEGESNPDDEAVLFALRAPDGGRGLYAAPYGPDVSTDDVAVIRALHDR